MDKIENKVIMHISETLEQLVMRYARCQILIMDENAVFTNLSEIRELITSVPPPIFIGVGELWPNGTLFIDEVLSEFWKSLIVSYEDILEITESANDRFEFSKTPIEGRIFSNMTDALICKQQINKYYED